MPTERKATLPIYDASKLDPKLEEQPLFNIDFIEMLENSGRGALAYKMNIKNVYATDV